MIKDWIKISKFRIRCTQMLKSDAGFSLFEIIVALVLVALFINGLLWTWHFVDSRRQDEEEYWESKVELELACETVLRQVRDRAISNCTILPNGFQFSDKDGSVWSFVLNGRELQRIINGETETILTECEVTKFTLNDRVLTIELRKGSLQDWNGDDTDLAVSGRVLLRNVK